MELSFVYWNYRTMMNNIQIAMMPANVLFPSSIRHNMDYILFALSYHQSDLD